MIVRIVNQIWNCLKDIARAVLLIILIAIIVLIEWHAIDVIMEWLVEWVSKVGTDKAKFVFALITGCIIGIPLYTINRKLRKDVKEVSE